MGWGTPGYGKAMESVVWSDKGQGLERGPQLSEARTRQLRPHFTEHNVRTDGLTQGFVSFVGINVKN